MNEENLENEDNKPIEIVSFSDLLKHRLNTWRDKLIESTVQFHEAALRRRDDPNAMILAQQGEMSISKIVELRYAPVVEARARVKTIEDMIAELESGEDQLAFRWSDDALKIPKLEDIKNV